MAATSQAHLWANPLPVVRIRGTITWVCPKCRTVHQTKWNDESWELHCGKCERTFAHGSRILTMPRGTRRAPFDITCAELAAYKSGGRVNTFTDCPDDIADCHYPNPFDLNTDK